MHLVFHAEVPGRGSVFQEAREDAAGAEEGVGDAAAEGKTERHSAAEGSRLDDCLYIYLKVCIYIYMHTYIT